MQCYAHFYIFKKKSYRHLIQKKFIVFSDQSITKFYHD